MCCRSVGFRGGVKEEDEGKTHVMLHIWKVERPRFVWSRVVELLANHHGLFGCD